MLVHFALWPWGPGQLEHLADGSAVLIGFQPWQLFTSAFLHADVAHIAFNMLGLWTVGAPIERGARGRHRREGGDQGE